MSTTTDREAFCRFVEERGQRLQHGLVAALGPGLGPDAASEALAYGWEHWDRVGVMDNPAGFLFTVGRNWGRRQFRKAARPFPAPPLVTTSDPLVEPGLPAALARLSDHQRVATVLVHGAGWTVSEVAALMRLNRGTVGRHAARGLAKLRRALEAGNHA